jgi:quercetin dioxygenase-like cupin family protein
MTVELPPVRSARRNKPFKTPPESPDRTLVVDIEGGMTNTKMHWHAKGEETNGACAVFEVIWATGDASVQHTHSLEDEGFYLISGKFTVHTPEGDIELKPGEFVWGPRGTRHAYSIGPQGAHLLCIQTPGTDLFSFFKGSNELDESSEGAFEAWAAWAEENFGMEIHDPRVYPPGSAVAAVNGDGR